jgi:hypothetical protein
MSLDTIVNTQPGNYINGSFTGTVKFAKQRIGKFGPYETAVIVVDGADVSAMSDAPIFVPNNNKTVSFSGKGMKRKDDYNGKPQISLGKSVIVTTQDVVNTHSENTQAYATTPKQAQEAALNGAELAKAWADLAVATRKAFNDAGLPEIADNAALRAPEWGALWWFGQRTVETPAPEDDLPY